MNDCQTWLLEWLGARAPHLPLEPHNNFFAAGAIDSFGVIELIEALEQTFEVRFSQGDFQDPRFVTVAGLAELVKEKRAP